MKLTLVTPEKKIVTGVEIKEILLPGHRGQLDILPGHSPLFTTLGTGLLKYKSKNDEVFSFCVSWGYCEVNPQSINVLAEYAVTKAEIDVDYSRKAKKELEKQVAAPDFDAVKFSDVSKRMAQHQAEIDFALDK